MSYYLLTLSFLAGQALAAAVLTGPAPGAIYYEGSSCIIQWNPDTTGTWKNMTIGKAISIRPIDPLIRLTPLRLDVWPQPFND